MTENEHEHESVRLTLRLPHDIAEQAKEVQKTDREFLSRIVRYGLTRRSIYRQLRKAHEDLVRDGLSYAFGEKDDVNLAKRLQAEDGIEPIPEEEGRQILTESRQHDGEAGVDEAGG